MPGIVDDLSLSESTSKSKQGIVDDLDLTEKTKPSLWDRAKSAVGMGEEAPKREMTVNPSSVTAAPQQEPAHGPMTAAVRLIQGVRDQKSEPLLLTKDAAGSAFIRTMSRVPENLLASGVKAVKGQAGVSVVDQDLGNRLVSWVEERNKALAKEYSDKGMISKRDVAELGPNLGFSGISMGAGILGGMGGGVAGSFLPGPGNVAGAVSGSMAASGTVAYRMQTYSAMMDWLTKINKESIAQTGKPITPAEEKKFKEHFDKLASESGLWEAGPEAVGNVLEIALMAGKGTLPGRLASLLPKGVAGKAIKGVARAAGIVGTEEATETITQHGQHNVEVKAGMSKEPIREWTSGDDLLKSAGDVLPGVLLLSGFMTGGGAIYRKAAGKNKTKQLSSPEELSKPAEVKAEEQPFVDDINISEEEVSPNATAEGKKPEGDIGEHSGTDRVGEAAGSGGSDITEPSGEVKEAPKVEPRRIIDDILKDLDEVQGQQAEIEKAKDAGIAVSPEKEVAVEQKADDLKTELADAVREERSVEEQKPSNDTEATTESKADNSQNVTPVTQNVTAGQSENVATLPPDISKSAPKYSYREKQFNIEFPDDVTKAAYIVRNSKKLSAKDAGFMSFLRSQYPEKTDEQIRALGESIKSDLTTQAKTAKHNTTLKVNSIIQEKENVDPAGQSDKIETDEVDFYDRPDSKKILDEAGTEGHEAADIAASLREGEEIGDSEGAILSPREVEAKVEKLAEELGVEKPSKRQAKRQPKNQKTEKEATNLAQFLVKAGKVRLGSFSSRTGTAWDRAHGMRGKDESRELGVIKAVASKNGKMSMDEAADYVNAEGFKDRNGKPFTDVTLFEELAYGDSRNVLHPELAESKIDKEIERQENEWIAEQLRKQGEEVDASAVEESRSDIEAGLLGSLEEEGYSSEQIEENAREVEDFFASVTKNNLEKPAESATIPDVTTPKGTASDIPAKTTPQAEAGLIQEAKKYKTVEEFVNAQGIEAWHGSRHKIEGELSLARGGEQGGDITKNGFTFSTQDVAEKYRYSGLSRDELVKMFGEADAKAIEDRTSILHGRIKMENPLLVDASGYDYKSKHYTDQKEGLRSKAFTEYIKQMEDGGHDGIIFTNVKDTPGKKADTTVYFIKDKNKFKTEEQLTHIWNKAHQLPNPSRPPEVGGQTLYSGVDPTQIIPVLKSLTNNIKEAWPHLEALGLKAYESGKSTYSAWSAEMKSYLGDLWESFKGSMATLWESVKAFNESLGERGSFSTKKKASEYDVDDVNELLDMAARQDKASGELPESPTYDEVRKKAAEMAWEKISKKIDFQKRRENSAMRKQAMDDARMLPAFQSMSYIIQSGGLDRAKLLKDYDKETVDELSKRRVGLIREGGALEHDVVADQMGYNSGDDMINDILDWRGLEEEAKKRAEEFEYRYSDLITSAELDNFNELLIAEEDKIMSKLTAENRPKPAKGLKTFIRQKTGQAQPKDRLVTEYDALAEAFRKEARTARAAFSAGKKGEVEKSKEKMRWLMRRRESLKNVRDYFGLTDAELMSATKRRNVGLMDDAEFKQFLRDVELRAVELADTRQAKIEVLALIEQKRLRKVDNYRQALQLPTLNEMTAQQLRDFAKLLEPFQEDDVFLTQRELETVDRTDLKGIKTLREARERLAAEAGVDVEELNKVHVEALDSFRWDSALRERDPFYDIMVSRMTEAYLGAELRAHDVESQVYELARKSEKSRDRSLVGRMIPQDDLIMAFLESPPDRKAAIVEQMTPEQINYANYMQAYFADALNYLIATKSLERGRENYFVHIRRSFLENLKDGGLKKAISELFKTYQQDQLVFNILDDDTGNILPLEKFFQFSLQRTDTMDPTRNVTKAFLTYVNTFERKKMFDAIIPKLDIYAQALTPTRYTPRGLEIDRSLKTYVNKWINNKKGRKISFDSVLRQGGPIDVGIRALRTFTTILDLGLSPFVQGAAVIGEQVANTAMLGTRGMATGTWRMRTDKGKRILKKYEAWVGRSIWEEFTAPGKEITERLSQTLFAGFDLATKTANKQFLLASMTDQEFEAEEISTERLAQMRLDMGRFRVVPGTGSLVGSTSVGDAAMQYKKWAVPIARTLIADAETLIGNIRAGRPLDARAGRELMRFAYMSAAVFIVGAMAGADDDDRSVIGKAKARMYREAMTLMQGVDPTLWLTTPRTLTWLYQTAQAFKSMVLLETYKSGDKEGELKGDDKLKRQFVPGVVRSVASED